MSRLRHDPEAYLQAIRMSRADLIVFIEGKENDPTFYSQVADKFQRENGGSVELRRARELPGAADPASGGSGGKFCLLKAARIWLRHIEEGIRQHTCRILFALDKDVDDLKNRQIQDPHFVYTQPYSVETYLLRGSDLQKSAEAALSLLPGELDHVINRSQQAWYRRSATLWREWIEFCVLASMYRHGPKIHGYSKASRANSPHHEVCDAPKLEALYNTLRADVGLSEAEFSFVRTKVQEFVDLQFDSCQEDKLMKGEWYVDILWSEVEADTSLMGRAVAVGKHGIWSAIRANFQLPDDVYAYYACAFVAALGAVA